MVVCGVMVNGGSICISSIVALASSNSIGVSKPKRFNKYSVSVFILPNLQGIASMPFLCRNFAYEIADTIESVSGCLCPHTYTRLPRFSFIPFKASSLVIVSSFPVLYHDYKLIYIKKLGR